MKRTILGKEYDYPPEGVLTHVKTGGKYVALCPAVIEADAVPAVAYTKLGGDGTVWIRPLAEFMDGRFTW